MKIRFYFILFFVAVVGCGKIETSLNGGGTTEYSSPAAHSRAEGLFNLAKTPRLTELVFFDHKNWSCVRYTLNSSKLLKASCASSFTAQGQQQVEYKIEFQCDQGGFSPIRDLFVSMYGGSVSQIYGGFPGGTRYSELRSIFSQRKVITMAFESGSRDYIECSEQ